MMGYQRHESEWERRQRLNAEAPEIEKAANEAYVTAIDAFLDQARPLHDISWPAHWIYHKSESPEDCEDYCLPCIKLVVARSNGIDRAKWNATQVGLPHDWHVQEYEARKRGYGWPERPEFDPQWEVDGGFDTESSPTYCECCGRVLDYSLHSVDDELYFFQNDLTDEQTRDTESVYAFGILLDAMKHLGPMDNDIIGPMVAIIPRFDVAAAIAGMPAYEESVLAARTKHFAEQAERDAAEEVEIAPEPKNRYEY